MDLDIDKLDQFFDATEEWNSAMNMSNSMAFISQFGEYNPGGGQDQVLKVSRQQSSDGLRASLHIDTRSVNEIQRSVSVSLSSSSMKARSK